MTTPENTPSWMEPRSIYEEINGEDVQFFEVPLPTFRKLRPIITSVFECLAAVIRASSLTELAGVITNQGTDQEGSFNAAKQRVSVDVEVVRHSDEQLREAVEKISTAMLDERNQLGLATLVTASMQSPMQPTVFLETVGSPVFAKCLIGALKANAGVFGPLAPMVEKLGSLDSLIDLKETLGKTSEEPVPSSSPEDGL